MADAVAIFADLLDEQGDEPWFLETKDRDPTDEFRRQTAVFSKAKIACPGVSFTAIPNSRKGSDWEKIRRWREGAVAGACDLVATWRGGGIGWIEMKNGTDMPSPEQRDYLNMLYRQGHRCGVFRQPETVLEHLRVWGAPFVGRRG